MTELKEVTENVVEAIDVLAAKIKDQADVLPIEGFASIGIAIDHLSNAASTLRGLRTLG